MNPSDQLVIPPPTPKILDYPGAMGVAFMVVFVTALLFVAGRYDPTHGALTISLLIVLTMTGAVVFCLFFTVPQDQTTGVVIGGLVSAFSVVVSYWLMPARKV